MKINELKDSWELIAQEEPYYGVLTNDSNKTSNLNLRKFFNSGRIKIRKIIGKLHDLEINLEHKICLDFGCGVGRLSQALCKSFDEVIGVDISKSMIELANKHNNHLGRCTYVLNEKKSLDYFESNRFDLVISFLTLQHMHPDLSFCYLDEFGRVLKDKGVLIIQLPTNAPMLRKVTELFIPARLNKFLKKLKSINGGIMEMYVLSKSEIIKNIAKKFKVIEIEDEKDKAGWTYSTFYLVKT